MPYLHDNTNDHKTPEKWKIQISIHVNFISSKDIEETRTIYAWSDNENFMWGNETDNIIKELFKSFLNNYQKEEQIMRGGRDFIFENNELMDFILHKTSLKRLGSYIESPEWLKTKEATINPKNEKDNKCFQYALTIALNYNEIKKKDIDFLSHQKV